MSDLFSEDPQFRRAQYTKLSDNVQEWPQEIAALVSEHLPRDIGLDVSVQFQKLDKEKGYGIATAIVKHPNAPKQVGVPIIVKSWHLAPIDIFFQEGKIKPLTDDNLARAFFQESVGAGLATPKPPPQMQDDQGFENRFPPIGGKYASANLPALILPTRKEEHIAELLKIGKADPNILAAYQKRGTFETLQKWAAPKESSQDELDKDMAMKVMTVKKDGPDKYRIFATNDNVFEPILVRADRQGLRHLLELKKSKFCDTVGDSMSNVDKNGEITLTPPESPYGKPVPNSVKGAVKSDGAGDYGAQLGAHRNPFMFDPLSDDRTVVQATEFGRYGVRDKSGVLAKGFVLPNVVNFNGSKASMKIFVGANLAAMQDRIAGIPLDDEPKIVLPVDRPETGKTGVMVYTDGKKAVATVPFTVTSVTIYKGERSIGVVDYKGNRFNLIPSPRVSGIMEIKESKVLGPLLGPGKNYLISAEMTFVRFPKITSVSESADVFKKMAAEFALDVHPLKVSMANGHYVFRGRQLGKYASVSTPASTIKGVTKVSFDFNSLARHEASFLLGAWGMGQNKIAGVLDSAKNHIVLEVHHLRYPATPGATKTASPSRVRLAASIRPPMADLIKSAAMLEDSDSVDTVLSLGFVNPENIDRFASVAPVLEDLSGVLAKLLLGSRLGLEDIPEESVRGAIMHLNKVLDGLVKLRMLSQQEKTSSVKRVAARQVELS